MAKINGVVRVSNQTWNTAEAAWEDLRAAQLEPNNFVEWDNGTGVIPLIVHQYLALYDSGHHSDAVVGKVTRTRLAPPPAIDQTRWAIAVVSQQDNALRFRGMLQIFNGQDGDAW